MGNYRLRAENCRYDLDMEGFWEPDKSRIIAVLFNFSARILLQDLKGAIQQKDNLARAIWSF
jgi:hypothetical protein